MVKNERTWPVHRFTEDDKLNSLTVHKINLLSLIKGISITIFGLLHPFKREDTSVYFPARFQTVTASAVY